MKLFTLLCCFVLWTSASNGLNRCFMKDKMKKKTSAADKLFYNKCMNATSGFETLAFVYVDEEKSDANCSIGVAFQNRITEAITAPRDG